MILTLNLGLTLTPWVSTGLKNPPKRPNVLTKIDKNAATSTL